MYFCRYLFSLLMILTVLTVGGCDQPKPQSPDPEPKQQVEVKKEPKSQPEKKTQPAKDENTLKETKLTLYFPDVQGIKLLKTVKSVKIDTKETSGKYKAALECLIEGTSEKGQTAIIPKKARLNGVKFADGNCLVDFSGEIVRNFVGGSTGEEMLVGSVVNTLTEFPEVKTVQILVDGEAIESLSGHMDLSKPLKRMDNLLK